MGYVSPIDIAKAEVIREGTKTGSLMEFLEQESITDPAIVAASIESETNFVERTEKLLMIEGELLAKAGGLKAYIKTLEERVATYEKNAKSIREAIEIAFERAKQPKISTMVGTVSTRANPLGAEVVDQSLVPTQFYVWKLNEAAAKKAAIERAKARTALAEMYLDGQEVEMTLALWQFDEENPEVTGVEVDTEVTYSIQVRRK